MCEENNNRAYPPPPLPCLLFLSLQKGKCDDCSRVVCHSGNKADFGNPQKELNSFHHLSLLWQNPEFLSKQKFSP